MTQINWQTGWPYGQRFNDEPKCVIYPIGYFDIKKKLSEPTFRGSIYTVFRWGFLLAARKWCYPAPIKTNLLVGNKNGKFENKECP